jgi:hypothetical protein
MTRGKKESSLALFLFRIIQFSAHRLQTRRSRVGRPRHLRVLHVNALRPRRRKHANVHALSANPQVAGREATTFACSACECSSAAPPKTRKCSRALGKPAGRGSGGRDFCVFCSRTCCQKHANVHALLANPQVAGREAAAFACSACGLPASAPPKTRKCSLTLGKPAGHGLGASNICVLLGPVSGDGRWHYERTNRISRASKCRLRVSPLFGRLSRVRPFLGMRK